MDYTGTLWTTGAQFDSSIGRAPFDFTLGAGQVIKGNYTLLLLHTREQLIPLFVGHTVFVENLFSHTSFSSLCKSIKHRMGFGIAWNVRGREAQVGDPSSLGLWRA